MAGVITTGSFQKALKPQVKAWFGDAYKDYPLLYKEYMEQISSNDAYEEDVLLSGMGLAKIKSQGAPVTYEDLSQGYTKRYDHVMYTNGFIITREAIQDLKAPAQAQRFAKSLKRSMLQSSDVVAANNLNRAFNNSYTGGDGKELCATDHPTRAADLRNELATAADLSEASLEDCTIDIMDFRDDRGLRMMAKPQMLVVPKEEKFNVDRILHSTLRVDSANNDLNSIRNLGIFNRGALVNPYLTDSDAFFIITDVEQGLQFIERTPIAMENDNDFDTMNAKFIASHRYATGWTDPRGVFGSPGA